MNLLSNFIEIFREYTNNTRFVITFLIILALFFSGTLICNKSLHKGKIDKNEIVGYLTYKTRIIKRKSDSTVVWYDVEEKQPLTRRDTILAEQLSDAVITLNDGTELRVGENSMVVLDFSGDNIKLDFKYGSIQAKRTSKDNSNLEIRSGLTTVELKDGDLNLNKNENDSLKLAANRGQATIKQGTEEINLKENTLFEAKPNEKPTVKEIKLILLTPEPMKFYNPSSNNQEISFSWTNNAKESVLEISEDKNFSKLFYTKKLKTNSIKVKLPLGNYHWRILANETNSEHRKFSILKSESVLLRFPKDNEEYNYIQKNLFINFAWNELTDIKFYNLEIASDINFKNVIINNEYKLNSVSLDFAKEGVYYFRVKAEFNNPDFLPKYSEIRSFRITKLSKLSQPELLNPPHESVLDHADRLLLNWKSKGYDTYILRVSQDANFKANIVEKTITENYFVLPELENNKTYYWNIEGNSESLSQRNSSASRSFTIKVKTIEETKKREVTDSLSLTELSVIPDYKNPVLLEPKSGIIFEEDIVDSVRFDWKKQEGEPSYTLHIYKIKSSKEEPVFQETTKKNFIELKEEKLLLKGEYSWFVEIKYKNKEDKLISKKSLKRNYKIIPPLLPPKVKKLPDIYYLEE